MKIYKDLIILTLLTIGLSLGAIKPVYASDEEITDSKSSSVETVKFQFFEELTYEEYISGIAEENQITFSEAAQIVSKNNKVETDSTYAYETRYGRFYNLYNYATGDIMNTVDSYTVRCGIYATYEVDSSNWQLRQFTNINSTYLEPGTSSMSINQIYSLYSNITSSTSVYYHVSACVTGQYNGTQLFEKSCYFYL